LEKQSALMILCPPRSGQHYLSLASGENVRRCHNSSIPLSIFASCADFIGQSCPLLIACDLLAMRGEFLSGGELGRQDFHLQASGERVKVGGGHRAKGLSELAFFVFADFAGLNLPGREAVKG
jgi:hypothetical protein